MNTTKLREFAPAARKGLISAIESKALRFGISAGKPLPTPVYEGEFVRIAGVLHAKSILPLFNDLVSKIKKHGFEATVEQAAYTWFNRLAAIRYMEVHGYFSHGLRVLSAPDDATLPEVLQQAQSVEIDGLDRKEVLELLTLGNRQEELYQLILRAQCHSLSNAMPFLFDRIDGATELLSPDNLLSSSSIVRQIVLEIPEDDWRTTEILGWLYQFYVSEEKARVDDLVKKNQPVAPEDIPAKTQLFTPNWIVQFLVQNSLGRLWMDVYPDSPLKDLMPYYSAPAEQTPEVAAQLAAITPKFLDPTELTAIDPAAGSGHILLEQYNLFFEMYREHGTLPSDIPRLILERNLFGLELDSRAAQIAGFAVLMRARNDDPFLLEDPPKLNVYPIRHSRDLDLAILIGERKLEPIVPDGQLLEDEAPQPKLAASGKPLISDAKTVREVVELFRNADIEGSLIRVPASLIERLKPLALEVDALLTREDLLSGEPLRQLSALIKQARILARRYTACVANPPYLGGKAMVKELKEFATERYPNTKADLFAMFMERGFDYAEPHGYNAMVTMQSWMFLSSYDAFRKDIIERRTISTMAHLGARAFPELKGEVVQTTATVSRTSTIAAHRGVYHRVTEGDASTKAEAIQKESARWDYLPQSEFKKIPGCPIAYWTSRKFRDLFTESESLGKENSGSFGMSTADPSIIHCWWEISYRRIRFDATKSSEFGIDTPFAPYDKGGSFRRWYGNQIHIINWKNDGLATRSNPRAAVRNSSKFCQPHISWTLVSSGDFSARRFPHGFLLDTASNAIYDSILEPELTLAILNSSSVNMFLAVLNPTLNFSCGVIDLVPIPNLADSRTAISAISRDRVNFYRSDWNEYETSWEFSQLVPSISNSSTISDWWSKRVSHCQAVVEKVRKMETENNRILAHAYGLEGDVETEVEYKSISLWANPLYVFRPKRKKSESQEDDSEGSNSPDIDEQSGDVESSELELKFRAKGVKELVSFSLGCMMGRYSLDEPGLIYAHAGIEAFDPSRYRTFPADADGIVPITDDLYFGDEDTSERLAQWVKTVWPNSPMEDNLAFIADSLYADDGGRKPEETPLEAIRRYLVNDFYKDHLHTYRNRPIYWLFSSGKRKAFQALVYLHRYTPNTLSRVRSDYVRPLLGQLQARLEESKAREQNAASTSSRKAQTKLTKKLNDQYEELLEFDKRLHYYALQVISLDLDDGVKVNYGKFHDLKIGPILAEEKKITGGKNE
jgi:hypothetical protein